MTSTLEQFSLWSVEFKVFEFIAVDKLVTVVDTKMMDYVVIPWTLPRCSFFDLLLQYAIGGLSMLSWRPNLR